MTDIVLPTPIRRLLQEAGLETEAPPERRIFTNRDLNLDKISHVGFDMDYTLAIYRQDAIERVSVEATVDKLVRRGYPEQIRVAEHDPRFAIRGLMVDKRLGNVIKMDRHGYVGRAYHGRRLLSSEERRGIYRHQRLGQEQERFAPVDTLFALPEVTLYAVVVDLLDQSPSLWHGSTPNYTEAWQDVRECIDESHRDGSIKDLIKADPEKYIERDPDLPRTLHKLRSAGKRLFLLTNSYFPYTDTVMRYLLGNEMPSYPDWTAYFDWTVVGARKPGFFADGMPFQELDRAGEYIGAPRHDVQRGKLYEGGNQQTLQASFSTHADEVLYVGDHIYGDIVRSKKSSGWRTALIVQELHQEIAVRRARGMTLREITGLHALRSEISRDDLVAAPSHAGAVADDSGRAGRRGRAGPGGRRAAPRGHARPRQAPLRPAAQVRGGDRRYAGAPLPGGRRGIQPVLGQQLRRASRHEPVRFAGRVVRVHLYEPGVEPPVRVPVAVLHQPPRDASALVAGLLPSPAP